MSKLTDVLHAVLNLAAGPEHALHDAIDKLDDAPVKEATPDAKK